MTEQWPNLCFLTVLDYDQHSSSDYKAATWREYSKHSKKSKNYGRTHCVGFFVRSARKIPTQGFSHNFEAFLSTPSLHVRCLSVGNSMLIMRPTESSSFYDPGTVMFWPCFIIIHNKISPTHYPPPLHKCCEENHIPHYIKFLNP